MEKIKLMIVDDHQIVIDGLRAMLLMAKGIKVVGSALTKEQLDNEIRHKDFDVLMLDVNMPDANGIEIAQQLMEAGHPAKIIMLTANTKKNTILAAVKAGVHGFLPKECDKTELVKAIERVADGEHYFGAEIAPIVYKGFSNRVQGKEANDDMNPLSEREIDVLRCFANGLSYKETAQALFISPRTVETHKKSIFKKLDLSNNADLIKYAIREGIIEL